MKAEHRAAIARILFDLIKADKVIDANEMRLLSELKQRFSITRADESVAFSVTLSEAVGSLSALPSGQRRDLLLTFEQMTLTDGYCAREEALLLTSLRLCLGDSESQADIISVPINDVWFDERQVLYIEARHDLAINSDIRRNLRTIDRELSYGGLDFIYLPEIFDSYASTPRPLLIDVAQMLFPSIDPDSLNSLIDRVGSYSTERFCIEQLHHKLGFRPLLDTPPALMMRINQSRVGEDIITNFLRVEISTPVIESVRRLIDTLLSFCSAEKVIVTPHPERPGTFLYHGFYRQIFEVLLLRRAVTCHLMVDFGRSTLTFPEIDSQLSLHRKERALYTLFIFYLTEGGISFVAPQSINQLERFNRRMDTLRSRYALIYEAFGGSRQSAPDITKPEIRNPMLTGIKKAIKPLADKIYSPESFAVSRNSAGIYTLSAPSDSFLVRDHCSQTVTSIFDCDLFRRLRDV